MDTLLLEGMEFIDMLEESGGVRSYIRRHANSSNYEQLVNEIKHEISNAHTKAEYETIRHDINKYISEIQHRLPDSVAKTVKHGLIAGTALIVAAGTDAIGLGGTSVLAKNSKQTVSELRKYLKILEHLLFQVNAKILQFNI